MEQFVSKFTPDYRQTQLHINNSTLPTIDFAASSQVVRVVAEGERLTYGHLFNPTFATEISLIDPLPHQRIAVYNKMLTQSRLRFLLADDAGAGKTIMSGLYIREMLTRRLIRRVLIVPPAGLVGNWKSEMEKLFSLPFRIVTGSDARAANPFQGENSDLLIVSVDTLAGERTFARLQEAAVEPYDLVIFDEAHKLGADRDADFTVRKTERYRLAEALAGIQSEDPRWQLDWQPRHLLLLTATPHMGKDLPYYYLWRLLEPEILSTNEAFRAYPPDARARHFIRRTKEEMVYLDGRPIYPVRESNTFSYELNQGDVSEQTLYDETTYYIQYYYNRAKVLNRSAARLAMSVFQRRLASSTYALMRSLHRRLDKLDNFISLYEAGKMNDEELRAIQRKLDQTTKDTYAEKTADEESSTNGREESEEFDDDAVEANTATSLADLKKERAEVERLYTMAQHISSPEMPDDSKFQKLYEVLIDPRFKDEKLIIFTEHRDTLNFLVSRLEGLGFYGQLAQIHGGMDYKEREKQVDAFRQSVQNGGAQYLIATDAAGEGINLQFCWLMVNYDIPWNPARLEQRMGRIHRYNQKHDKVLIFNLVAGKTREGRVLKTLLDKLEIIRLELRSDKVFDVIGRTFEGVSLRQYLEQAITEGGAQQAEQQIKGQLTVEQVRALQAREKHLYGGGGDVKSQLPGLRQDIEREIFRRLMPGHVLRFLEKAAPLINIGIEGDIQSFFKLTPLQPGALDIIQPLLESYKPEQRDHLTVYRPSDKDQSIFIHPGERLFDRLRNYVCQRFESEALRGAVFVDATAAEPYIFHLAVVSVERKADPNLFGLERNQVLEYRLVGVKHTSAGTLEECPIENLLLLKDGQRIPPTAFGIASRADASRETAFTFIAEEVAAPLAARHKQQLIATLPERERFVRSGYDYQEGELADARSKQTGKAREGNPAAKAQLTRIKERQQRLGAHRDEAIAVLRREPELIEPGEITWLAHALVVPSSDPADIKRQDAEVEQIAVQIATAYEEAQAARVLDVSKPNLAQAAGLEAYPGHDLLSLRPDGTRRCIEVKGRANVGAVELTENEWPKACTLGNDYWLYVVYNCASSHPRLHRIQNPFSKLIAKVKGNVLIDASQILNAAEID